MSPRSPGGRRDLAPGAFRLLFDLHPDPLWVYDTETLRILAANEASSRLYGYSQAEFLALTLADLDPGHDSGLARRLRDDAGSPSHGWRQLKKNGTPVAVTIRSSPLDFGGRPARLVWICEEGRERELLPLLSHELRAPLGTILLWAQLLKEGGQDPAGADRALGMIERGVRSLEQVADDILDLSRIAAGDLTLDTSPTDLAELVSGALGQARPTAEQKGVELVYAAAGSPATITGDPPRLRRMLARLLGLALKSTPRGGRVEVRLDQEGEQVRVVISDTGIGFSPPVPPGQREGEGDLSRAQRSIELGLSLVRQVVGLHGGRLEVGRRGTEEGGRLVIALPRGQPAAGPGPDPTPEAGRLPGTRVLVVEDDDDSREALKIILEQWGASVVTAASAGEALERLKVFRPHVLLSDLAMPGEDGYSLIRRVRALDAHEGGRTPAAALTAFARPDDRQQALAAGYQRHVSKPLDPADLFAVVAALARSRPGR